MLPLLDCDRLIFICSSPLHLLIVKRIIHYFSLDKKIDLVLLYLVFPKYGDFKQGFYYVNATKHLFTKTIVLNFSNFVHPSEVKKFLAIRRLRTKGLGILSSGFHINYVRFLLWLLNPMRIFSFDDGLTSWTLPDKSYWSFKQNPWVELWMRPIIRRYSFPGIKQQILTHYSVYPRVASIVPQKTIYVPGICNEFAHFPTDERVIEVIERLLKKIRDDTVKILLTQPLSEIGLLSLDEEVMFYKRIITRHAPHFFLKHPGERRKKRIGIFELDIPWIAEHFLSYLVSKGRKLELIGRPSSVHAHLLMCRLDENISIVLYEYKEGDLLKLDLDNILKFGMWFSSTRISLPYISS